MQPFPVDDEVVQTVWKLAKPKPFEQLTFNTALRRVLRLTDSNAAGAVSRVTSKPEETGSQSARPADVIDQLLAESYPRSKAPKADLKELVRAGLLHDGEELFLINYQGARVEQFKATIAGGLLQFKGHPYSMSDLARDLLKKVGFHSESVRGPAHWVNAKGTSVKELWQRLLDKRSKDLITSK